MLEEDEEVELKMDPNTEKKPLLSRLLQPSSPRLKVAFIYEKTVTSSAWTYAHELGSFIWSRHSRRRSAPAIMTV